MGVPPSASETEMEPNTYFYLKSLHIIGFVSWFAGLLYLVRLFIYHVEAQQKPDLERKVLQSQFVVMERRLWYGITWPAAIATLVFGLWLMMITRAWVSPWFHIKALFLVVLFIYHFRCGAILKNLRRGIFRHTSKGLRIWNEGATLLLFIIVFTAVLKSPVGVIYGMLGLGAVALVVVVVLMLFRKSIRNRKA